MNRGTTQLSVETPVCVPERVFGRWKEEYKMWEFLFVKTGKRRSVLCVASVESLKCLNYKTECRKVD